MAKHRTIIPAERAKVRGLSVLAIDPGVSGACVFVDRSGRIRDFFRIPTVKHQVGAGMRRFIDSAALHDLLALLDRAYSINVAIMEDVSAYRQGVTSAFTFGRSVGLVEGILISFGIEPYKIRPQVWKKHCGLIKSHKRASIQLAKHVFKELNCIRKTDTGIADAALMALYLHQTRGGNLQCRL